METLLAAANQAPGLRNKQSALQMLCRWSMSLEYGGWPFPSRCLGLRVAVLLVSSPSRLLLKFLLIPNLLQTLCSGGGRGTPAIGAGAVPPRDSFWRFIRALFGLAWSLYSFFLPLAFHFSALCGLASAAPRYRAWFRPGRNR